MEKNVGNGEIVKIMPRKSLKRKQKNLKEKDYRESLKRKRKETIINKNRNKFILSFCFVKMCFF